MSSGFLWINPSERRGGGLIVMNTEKLKLSQRNNEIVFAYLVDRPYDSSSVQHSLQFVLQLTTQPNLGLQQRSCNML